MKVILLLVLPLADIVTDWFMGQFVNGIANFLHGIVDTCCGMFSIISAIVGTIVFLYLRKRHLKKHHPQGE